VHFADLVATSDAVAAVPGRLEKIDRLAGLFSRLAPEETEIATGFLTGLPRQGKLGVGGAMLSSARDVAPATAPTLTLFDVDNVLALVARMSGPGSTRGKTDALRGVFSRATRPEQDFLARLMFGELRQGALEGVLVEAIARAAHVPAADVRRAAMMAGDLGAVARVALTEGQAALARFLVQLFRPVQPMLADSAQSIADALARTGQAALEYKLDGARIQVHKDGDEVRVYSRNLRDVTPAVPEVVEVTRALPVANAILDGEVVALRPDATPHPFQVTMRRFGRRLDVERLRGELPLTPFFFDALQLDGATLIDEPQSRRFAMLVDTAPERVVPHLVTASPEQAEGFLREALARGHEGVMAKALDAPYAAGSRGSSWLKVKQARTLDLVILGAEWGNGRRRGWLSNLHLGARDAERGGFVMLGKTFKGLTDEMLTWQTERLLALEIGRDDYTVFVRPELVAEIAFNEIQASPQYPGGLALRFARVKRYRTDKSAGEADTIATVQDLYRRMTGTEAPARR
jgi:DNA ligase-1